MFDRKQPEQRVTYCGSNPVSDLWCEKALALLAASFRTAVHEGSNLEARSNMMLAATFAGMGFGNSGVHIPHANAYPIAGMVKDFRPRGYPQQEPMVPHGMSVSLYDYRCPQGHVFEQMAAITAKAQQDCPFCGQASGKVPSRVSLGGHADPGPAMAQMPQTWRGTYEGNPEYVGQLRRQWDARRKLEGKYDELRGDQRPVLAHEGRYHGAPLRAGDPPPASGIDV